MQGGEREGIWTEAGEVHSYEADLVRRMTLESLFKLFQEAAWNHAEHLGVGYSHLRQRDQAWVLSRILVCVDSFPEWGQPVEVRTWPRGVKSLLALRDFELVDERGRILAGATSGWIVVGLKSRKPLRTESMLASIRTFPDRRAVGADAEKIIVAETMPVSTTLEVRYSDLDLNDHVNNATYVRWILDSYPVDFHRKHRVARIALNFVAEVTAGEKVLLSSCEPGPFRALHTLTRQRDCTESCRAEIHWLPATPP